MKIASSAVAMESSHALSVRHETSEKLVSWRGNRPSAAEGAAMSSDRVPEISESARAVAADEARSAADNDPFILLLRTMIEWFTGEPVVVFDASRLHFDAAPSGPAQPGPATDPLDFGIEYDYHALREEFERTEFSAQGVIRTADGRQIAFSLAVSVSRHYREEININVQAGEARRKDPLVINFEGNAAQLTSQRFRFDLDADGHAEDVPLLGGGSGYLALDLDGNGRIDSGAELFGPATGSGFAELAKHDEDGNGWIDEADTVFERLRIWTPDASGAGSLTSLAAKSVGALYLGHAATPFELRGPGNEDLGAIRDTGMFLLDWGTAGSLQEIDLTA